MPVGGRTGEVTGRGMREMELVLLVVLPGL